MSDIFISYSSIDRDVARMLAGALEREGWSVWWDRSILPGKTYDRVIEKELEAARCVIVIWTRESVESDWVRAEAGEALNRGTLVPVLREEVEIPLVFRQIHAAHLQDWDGDARHPGFQQLIKAVAANVSAGAPEGMTGGEEAAAGRIEALRKRALAAKSMEELTAVRDELDELLSSGEEVTGAGELRQQIESAIRQLSATGEHGAAGTGTGTATPQPGKGKSTRSLGMTAAVVAVVGVLAAGGWFVFQQSRPVPRGEAVSTAEREAAQRRATEEEARRRASEAQQRLAEDQAARRAEEEAARRTEEEAARREEQEAARVAEEESARKRADEEAARRLAEEQAARRAAEEAERQRVLERQRREEQAQSEIERLLAAARAALAEDRLSVPEDNSALAHYRRVLTLDPGNAAARQGLVDIGNRYAELAARAMEQGKLEDAGEYLARGQSLLGNAEPLRALGDELEARRRQAVRSRPREEAPTRREAARPEPAAEVEPAPGPPARRMPPPARDPTMKVVVYRIETSASCNLPRDYELLDEVMKIIEGTEHLQLVYSYYEDDGRRLGQDAKRRLWNRGEPDAELVRRTAREMGADLVFMAILDCSDSPNTYDGQFDLQAYLLKVNSGEWISRRGILDYMDRVARELFQGM